MTGRLLAAVAGALLLSAAAVGASGNLVAIEFRLSFTRQEAFTGTLAGSFTATGAIRDAGRVRETYALSLPWRRGGQPVQRVRARSTLVGRLGTITTRYEGTVSSASETRTVTEGRWRIVSGTGRYRGLRGGGRFSAIVDLERKTMEKRYDGFVSAPASASDFRYGSAKRGVAQPG